MYVSRVYTTFCYKQPQKAMFQSGMTARFLKIIFLKSFKNDFFKARTPSCGHLPITEGVFFLYAAKSFGFFSLKRLDWNARVFSLLGSEN